MTEVHYLSATIVKTPGGGDAHMAFCGELLLWHCDRNRYQVANYSDPTRVTCPGCMIAWAGIYPIQAAEFRRRYPRPTGYVPPAEEPADVNEMRTYHATHMRAWARMWINDATVSDTDFAYALHELTYGHAKELARFALELYREEGENNA